MTYTIGSKPPVVDADTLPEDLSLKDFLATMRAMGYKVSVQIDHPMPD
jgi:hypothetical protein